MGGYNGLDKIDRNTGSITNVIKEMVPYVIKPDPDEPDKFVWIGTENSRKTLYRMDLKNCQWKQQKLESDYIVSMYSDKNHTLWIGTSTQLIKFDTKKGTAERFNHDPFNSVSLPAGAVKTIIRDRKGVLWIGTTHGGVSWFDENKKTFTTYQQQTDKNNCLNNNMVLCLFADSANRIWIATGGGGVNILDTDRRNFSHLTTENGLPNDFIYSIVEDDNKML